MTTHLVIPDSHAQPGVDNDRFTWLGKWIADNRPDVIINIGDMADMKSLSMYDVGKLSAEGRRYSDDIAAFKDAMDKMLAPIEAYNRKRKKQKKGPYKPRMVYCLGNHEYRIERAYNEEPKYFGTISIKDLCLEEYGWEVVPFTKSIIVDDIAYSHYFTSGVMMRPIGGLNHARKLLSTQFMSATAGHSHLRDFAEHVNVAGRRFCATVVGCYFEHEEDWAGEANKLYWRGLVHKTNVVEGSYDPNFINIDELRDKYG